MDPKTSTITMGRCRLLPVPTYPLGADIVPVPGLRVVFADNVRCLV